MDGGDLRLLPRGGVEMIPDPHRRKGATRLGASRPGDIGPFGMWELSPTDHHDVRGTNAESVPEAAGMTPEPAVDLSVKIGRGHHGPVEPIPEAEVTRRTSPTHAATAAPASTRAAQPHSTGRTPTISDRGPTIT